MRSSNEVILKTDTLYNLPLSLSLMSKNIIFFFKKINKKTKQNKTFRESHYSYRGAPYSGKLSAMREGMISMTLSISPTPSIVDANSSEHAATKPCSLTIGYSPRCRSHLESKSTTWGQPSAPRVEFQNAEVHIDHEPPCYVGRQQAAPLPLTRFPNWRRREKKYFRHDVSVWLRLEMLLRERLKFMWQKKK